MSQEYRKGNFGIYIINNQTFKEVSSRYGIPMNQLSGLIKEYVVNGSYDVFRIKLSALLGDYDSFAYQHMSADLRYILEEYRLFDRVIDVEVNDCKVVFTHLLKVEE